ncbi:hypothetical protein M3Y98_00909400 [Aphelenchoides besseyi]|nr:hypothetical protein M3Y98_00909400 [Aphelenchoides besseyi]KAI6193547.1 hypothetical protein M3Y96_01029800 [Aphelenchoides besseyi]
MDATGKKSRIGGGKSNVTVDDVDDERCALVRNGNRNAGIVGTQNERTTSSATISSASVTPPPLLIMSNNSQTERKRDREPSDVSSSTVASSVRGDSKISVTSMGKRVALEKQPLPSGSASTTVASALPDRLQHRRLKKYASETSFAVGPSGQLIVTPRRLPDSASVSPPPSFAPQPSQIPLAVAPTVRQNSNNSSGVEHDVRSHGRVFHVRAAPAISATRGNGATTVAQKLNRRRQDSDDASGSINSETTVASGTVTPVSRRMLRFKLRRPKSTGSMGNHQAQDTIGSYTPGGTHIYDPSYTSATVHSLDSNQPLTVQDIEGRRPSNFYIFDDDSMHEFDDEIQGLFDRSICKHCVG